MHKQLIALLVLTSLVFGSWGITRLTNNQPMKLRGSLRVSPDGKSIVSIGVRQFQSPSPDVILTDLATGNEQIIVSYSSDLSWSYQSDKFMYSSLNASYLNSVYTYDINKQESVLLIENAKSAKYSPVSNKMAYLIDSTVYLRNLDSNQDILLLSDSTIIAFEWAQNSDQFLYLISKHMLSPGIFNYRISSLNVSDLSLKEIYRSYHTETSNPQNLLLANHDYQFCSYIKNGAEQVLIAKANPFNSNTKDSIMIYKSSNNSLSVLLEYQNQPYHCNTGFYSPKWSPNGNAFAVQYGTEEVDYGCNHKVLYYNFADSSSCLFDNSGGEFVNPVFLDSTTIVFTGNFTSTNGDLQVDICRADYTLGINTENKPVGTLLNNYPNPFNNSTVINYTLPTAGSINLAIYNTKGELVKKLYTGRQSAGRHASTFNASGLNSGVYYIRLKYGNNNKVHKVLLVK